MAGGGERLTPRRRQTTISFPQLLFRETCTSVRVVRPDLKMYRKSRRLGRYNKINKNNRPIVVKK